MPVRSMNRWGSNCPLNDSRSEFTSLPPRLAQALEVLVGAVPVRGEVEQVGDLRVDGQPVRDARERSTSSARRSSIHTWPDIVLAARAPSELSANRLLAVDAEREAAGCA